METTTPAFKIVKNPTLQPIKEKLNEVFDQIIENTLITLKETKRYLIRPAYGYEKFYMNNLDSDGHMGVLSLLHYVLKEEGLYREFLSDEDYNEMLDGMVTDYSKTYKPSSMNGLADLIDLQDHVKMYIRVKLFVNLI